MATYEDPENTLLIETTQGPVVIAMRPDLAPNHVDEEYMRGTPYGRRIAHGALLIGFMSTASTMMVERHGERLQEVSGAAVDGLRAHYLRFLDLNVGFKELCSRWLYRRRHKRSRCPTRRRLGVR